MIHVSQLTPDELVALRALPRAPARHLRRDGAAHGVGAQQQRLVRAACAQQPDGVLTTGQSGEICVTVFSTAALCTRLDCVRRPLRLLERILYLYADLRRREWPRRGSGLVDFLVRLTLPLYRDFLGLGLPPKRYLLVARIRLRGNRLDIDFRRYFDVLAFDWCRAFGCLRIWRQ